MLRTVSSRVVRASFLKASRSAPSALRAPQWQARPSVQLRQLSVSVARSRALPLSFAKDKLNQDVTYDELKPLTEQPSDDVLLVDVREIDEVMQGNIPSSVNLPLSDLGKTLELDSGEFTRLHGFYKPTKEQPMVFYCRTGKRSEAAKQLAEKKGYQFVRNYKGSWADWVANENKSS
ncbi:uncharacterized protein L969DRAFT_95408 [Mixia osmundae IAM 14324]|uniref:Rhodanese domain-containing protein n=1 Tax=Mixia osmundae (strain CBS 9802 / IAM 14324 / JCM 22182 / KY 12970) TaxID=764103 RepID=G7E0F0_MIXOS|nr:uncharacterized protein L969DRAFT_95408 [Mixia osmundae IAM 14324]KEI38318.1 hypothetical protein L969DRAFT_95408 [Mixia osmundae IAM 14324]GAA96310.1 hypothetical protein E5Q_02976 [Mixia osmundae IAM 14324]